MKIKIILVALILSAGLIISNNFNNSAFAGDHTVIDTDEGTATTVHKDGSVTVEDDAGNIAHVDKDGNMVAEDEDGNTMVMDAEGNAVVEHEDGTTVIDSDGNSVTIE